MNLKYFDEAGLLKDTKMLLVLNTFGFFAWATDWKI